MLMLAFSLVFGLITVTSSGCKYLEGEDGNGKVKKETRDIKSFDAIKIGGAFEVHLTQGDRESLVVEADENLLKLITAEVKGGTLVVSTEKNIRNSKELNLYITFKDISKLDLSGAVEVKSEGMIKLDNLELEGSGASEVTLKLELDRLTADFSGASEINLSGSANTCDFDMSGASEVDAYGFTVKECTIELSGAGEARLNVTDNLKARVSGAGEIRYEGNPSVDSRVSGAGSIKKR